MNRINPRRPESLTEQGIKRIKLMPAPHPAHEVAAKPLRIPMQPKQCLLAVAHSDRGVLDTHARQTISAAAILADGQASVTALVMGELHESLSDCGADQVIVLPHLENTKFQPELELAALCSAMEKLNPQRVLLPDNQAGDGDLGRRLIAHFAATKTAATGVVEMNTQHVVSYQHGGSQLAERPLTDIILLAADAVSAKLPFTTRATLTAAPSPSKGEGWDGGFDVSTIDTPPSSSFDRLRTGQASPTRGEGVRGLGMVSLSAKDVALEQADFIVSAGNGVTHVDTFIQLAELLDAPIGASRVVVDDGRFARDKQIGATGKTVTASAYIAIGISGAVQHLQGIKDCRHVIAINQDASAPMIKRADLAVIGDAEEVMQALIALVQQAKLQEAA